MTLGDRARAALSSIDDGCTTGEIRGDVETLLGDLVATGVADLPVERGDLVMSLEVPA